MNKQERLYRITDKWIPAEVKADSVNIFDSPDKDSSVIMTVFKGDQLLIDRRYEDNVSLGDYYSVCTEIGVEGYCPKDAVAVFDDCRIDVNIIET